MTEEEYIIVQNKIKIQVAISLLREVNQQYIGNIDADIYKRLLTILDNCMAGLYEQIILK